MIDFVYNKFSLKGKAILDLLSYSIFFFPFIIVIITQGLKYAAASWAIKEQGWSAFPMPIYLTKTCIPLFGITMGIQGLVTYFRVIMTLITGEDWYSKCKYKKEEIEKIVINDVSDSNSR
jgi:TRAP-type mannitol/chloroaromatic compound transport system permease small subunit